MFEQGGYLPTWWDSFGPKFNSYLFYLCARLDLAFFAESWAAFFDFFFFSQLHYLIKSTVNSALVHCLWTHKFHFSATFSLKMGPTILFTHLKIILLQCFQFQFSVSVKISSIQMDPL